MGGDNGVIPPFIAMSVEPNAGPATSCLGGARFRRTARILLRGFP